MSDSSAKQGGGAQAPPPDWVELDKEEADQVLLDEFVKRMTGGDTALHEQHRQMVERQRLQREYGQAIAMMKQTFKPEAFEGLVEACPVCGSRPPMLPVIAGACQGCAAKLVLDFKKAKEEANTREAKQKAAQAIIKEYDNA